MLQELLKAFSGSLETTAYTLPQANGLGNVPPKETFKNFFSNFVASLNSSPSNTFLPLANNSPNGIQQATRSPYQNIPRGLIGQFPNQISHHTKAVRKNLKAFSPGPYKPGATVMYLADSQLPQSILPQGIPPQLQTNISPVQALVGAGNEGLGLQGYTNQFGQGQIIPPAGNLSSFSQLAPLQRGSSGFGGLLGTLIMPVFNLIGVLTSLFQVKKLIGTFKPIRVNQDNLEYMQYQKYIANTEAHEEGSFDDYDSYTREEESSLISDDYASGSPLSALY